MAFSLPDRTRCSGCSACFAVCPKRAIVMCPDEEGFLQPVVNSATCCQCGLCQKICPVLQVREGREPCVVYAAEACDDELRLKSSSGGVFSLLAREAFRRGGIVYGAGWEPHAQRVIHKSAENEEELADLRGSKYVQSDIFGTYSQVKTQLETGRFVLFTGCPCQIGGLKAFLQKEHENLLCVDLICHGVPSPLVFERYLSESGQRYGGKVKKVLFRDKKCGWKNYSIRLSVNGAEHLIFYNDDFYLKGFLNDLYLRLSCYSCCFRSGRSGADVTLGDYWHVASRFPHMDDDKGTSLILLMTEKGKRFFGSTAHLLKLEESNYDDAKKVNPALISDYPVSQWRGKFLKKLNAGAPFSALVGAYVRKPIYTRALREIKRLMRFFPRRNA